MSLFLMTPILWLLPLPLLLSTTKEDTYLQPCQTSEMELCEKKVTAENSLSAYASEVKTIALLGPKIWD